MNANVDTQALEAQVMAAERAIARSMAERYPQGQAIARFNSIWRQEAPAVWRVVSRARGRCATASGCPAHRAADAYSSSSRPRAFIWAW